MRKLLLALGFLLMAVPAKGTNDVYLSNAGGGTGTSCSSAEAPAYFNTPGNWTTGIPTGIQIGPGTTVHLCGAFTPAAGTQLLVAKGSGTSGNPVTIFFENGTTISSPYFNGNGEIYLGGRSWITVDGNRASGAFMGATDNGSAAAGYHNQQTSFCINVGGTTNITIQNLVCQNMYVHIVTSPDDEAIDRSQVGALNGSSSGPSTNLVVNNCHFPQMGWAITAALGTGTNIEFTEFDHMDHGIADGGATTGANTGISIHDNHFHDFQNWDTSNDRYHHDGIHLWGVDTSGKGYHSGASIYNNLFDGDSGANMTSWIFLENDIQSSNVYNNVIIPSTTNIPANGWINLGGRPADTIKSQNNAEYNNAIIGNNPSGNACYWSSTETNLTFENNIGLGCQTLFTTAGTTETFATFDHNTWEDMSSAYGDTKTFSFSNVYQATLAQWRAACNCDAHSQSVSKTAIDLDSTGHPQPGSVVIGAGVNLTSLNIPTLDKDKAGVARPATAAWDEGAYQGQGSSTLIDFGNGFTSTGMAFNGSAVLNGTRLQLTGGSQQAGSGWFTTPVNVQTFTSDFTFQLINPNSDGITFTVQNAGTTALGPNGGGLGYGAQLPGGTPGIPSSVAIKFDLFQNSHEGTNSTGLYTDGASPTSPSTTLGGGVNLHSGDVFHATVTYDGTTATLTITDTVTNATFTTSWTIDIPGTVGGSTAFAGFTGGTGTATQQIITWTYSH